MFAHYCILANGTNKTRFLPVMRPQVLVVLNAGGKMLSFTKCVTVKNAPKINPLSAIL